mgnify:CR=1 FL=1
MAMINKQTTESKLKELSKLSDEIKYVEEEFNQKLWGSCPDGDVKLHQMIDFAKEYDWLLEMIINLSKKV